MSVIGGGPYADLIVWYQTHEKNLHDRKGIEITRFFNGHHRTVFEHVDYPNKVIKIDSTSEKLTEIDEAIQKTIQYIKETGNKFCFVPNVERVRIDDTCSIWIEDKLEGVYDWRVATDKAERIFEACEDDPELKAKWIAIFKATAEVIIYAHYSDVSWKNLLLMEEGIGFVDFENVTVGDLTPYCREKLERTGLPPGYSSLRSWLEKQGCDSLESFVKKVGGNISGSGIYHLLQLVPPFAMNAIVEVIKENKLEAFINAGSEGWCSEINSLPFEEKMKVIEEKRRVELQENTLLRRHYDTLSDPLAPLSTEGLDKMSWRYRLISDFNECLESNKNYSKDPIYCRSHPHYYPYAVLSLSDEDQLRAKEEKEEVEMVLNQLKEEGIVRSWEYVESGFCYNVHF